MGDRCQLLGSTSIAKGYSKVWGAYLCPFLNGKQAVICLIYRGRNDRETQSFIPLSSSSNPYGKGWKGLEILKSLGRIAVGDAGSREYGLAVSPGLCQIVIPFCKVHKRLHLFYLPSHAPSIDSPT